MQTVPSTELPKMYMQMDEEGYFLSSGARVSDLEMGHHLLASLKVAENGAYVVDSFGTLAILEPFDSPQVLQSVTAAKDSAQWVAHFPYEVQKPFELNTLEVDEWDRFHGRTTDGLPFVMSRKGQNDFFNQVDEFWDDGFEVSGQKFQTPLWMTSDRESLTLDFWSKHYNDSNTPWDLNQPSPVLAQAIPQLKLQKSRVLVTGCGRGHDAALLAQCGHIVTAMDFSEEALNEARKLYGDVPNLEFVQADVLNLPNEYREHFDMVFDHTCYCAIPPEERGQLVKSWRKALTEQGFLLGVFFVRDRPQGPPFGGTEWEIRQRLQKGFHFLYWTRCKNSVPRRQGIELLVYAQKKDLMSN